MRLLTSTVVDSRLATGVLRRSQERPRLARIAGAAVLAQVLGLAGCAGGLSGLGGSSEFQCKAPPGVPCMSISGVHANERAGNLPAQRNPTLGAEVPRDVTPQKTLGTQTGNSGEGGPDSNIGPAPMTAKAAPKVPNYLNTGASPARMAPASSAAALTPHAGLGAIRSDPTVIRMWIAPWEDADGDLNDQGFVYLQIDSGRWLIEHNRAQIRKEFAPQRMPLVSVMPAGAGAAGAGSSAAASAINTLREAAVNGMDRASGLLSRLSSVPETPAASAANAAPPQTLASGAGLSQVEAALLGRAMSKGALREGGAAAAAAAAAQALAASNKAPNAQSEVRP